MRELKFRYWNGQMMLQDVGTHPFLMIRHENDNDELMENNERGCLTVFNSDENLMQYTGLKDKNGKEIYEGDICKRYCHDFKTEKPTFVLCDVRWGSWCYQLLWNKDVFVASLDIILHNSNALEVIGNIYENPELIQEQKNG